MKLSRRRLLQGASALSLAGLRPGRALAAPTQPKRLLLMVHRHGTIPEYWTPGGGSGELNLPPLLDPLAPWQDRIALVSGIDNRIPSLYRYGYEHAVSDSSLLTGALPGYELTYTKLYSTGPSVDQVVAERIGGGTPFPSLNLAVGSDEGGQVTNTHFLFNADGHPVSSIADPVLAHDRLFGGGHGISEAVRSALSSQLSSLSGTPAAHGALLQRVLARSGGAECSVAAPLLPEGYDYRRDDDLSSLAQMELMTAAMACDLTRVGTLVFDNLDDAAFDWILEDGSTIIDPAVYRSWTDMAHYGGDHDEPLFYDAIKWYSHQFAQLLSLLEATADSDGDSLLDTTLVLWISEYRDSWSHSHHSLPVVLAGAAQSATGQYRDLRDGGNGANSTAVNSLWVSLLQAFGGDDESFGHASEHISTGAIEGLL